MGGIDSLTQERFREWQARRMEIKEQMHSYPERTLELSAVLDLMDEEHAAIRNGLAWDQTGGVPQDIVTLDRTTTVDNSPRSVAGRFDLQLNILANSPEDLRRLLEMAVFELQRQIDAKEAVSTDEVRRYPGGMSGTLGSYNYELGISGEDCYE
ncbi:hypothetical protein K5D36_24765 [Pseudomonas cichorii]|nr:hypothetical protein [Pseudomonas cichorii]